MGDRGPAPRREAEVRRTNNKGTSTKLTREVLQDLPFEIDFEPDPLEAPKHWDDILVELWDALKVDPARKWMTSADWAATKLMIELTNTQMGATDKDGNLIGVSGAHQSSLLKHLSAIGVTEAARLRLQKEVTLFPVRSRGTGDGKVVDIREARKADVQ